MAKTISELKAQSADVRYATSVGENTATRVGQLFTDIVDHVEEFENTKDNKDASQDATMQGLVSTERNRAQSEESTLRYSISSEVANRQSGDQKLENDLTVERSARETADENIRTALANETARAQAAEQELAAAQIYTAKINDGAVTTEKIADGAVTYEKTDIIAQELGTNVTKVPSQKIVTDAIQKEKTERKADVDGLTAALGSETIQREQADEAESNRAQAKEQELSLAIQQETERAMAAEEANATSIIGTDRIADRAVTSGKIALQAITKEKLGIDCVREVHIADGAVTASKIADGAVTSDKLVDGALIEQLKKTATFAGIATPTTNPGTPDGPVFYVATEVGIYSNFNNIAVTEGEAVIFKWDNGTWSKKATGFATQDKFSQLKQEQIQGGIYDVSVYNGGAVFESLSDLLNHDNLSTLIPTSVRCGGMSIRFIQGTETNSDNKYVQWRYMCTDVTGNPNPFLDTNNWQGVDDVVNVGSANLPSSNAVLLGIKNNSALYVCDTASATREKTIIVPNYILGSTGALRIKFTHKNTFANYANSIMSAQLNINNTGAKSLYYMGIEGTVGNSWNDGEIVEVYYDATAENGNGAYFAYPTNEKRNSIVIYKFWYKTASIASLTNFIGNYVYLYDSRKLYFVYLGKNVANVNLKEIALSEDVSYMYAGERYHYNGTELVKDNELVYEADLLNCFVSSVTLGTNGVFVSSGNGYVSIPFKVNTDNRIYASAKGLKVVGYSDSQFSNPVLLSKTWTPSTSTTGIVDKMIPDGVNYVVFEYVSTLTTCKIFNDIAHLFDTIDVDYLKPLSNDYYTFATAIASIPLAYAKLGLKIKFRVDEHNYEEYTYMLSSAISEDLTNIRNWKKKDDEEYENKGYISTTDKNIIIDNNGHQTSSYSLSDIVRKNYAADTDFYIECVVKFVSNSTIIVNWLGLKNICYVRTIRGRFEIHYRGSESLYFGQDITIQMDNLYHHLMIVKYHEDVIENEETVRKHYLAFYIDGVKKGNSADVTSLTEISIPEKSTSFNVGNDLGNLLYRIGMPSLAEGDVEGLIAKHFNNGNPLSYVCDDNDTIAEILGYNMHSDYLVNSVNGLSLAVSDVTVVKESPYDSPLYGEGASTSVPKYVGQKYIDLLTNNSYIAKGTILPSDWHKEATMTEVNALKTQTKTVNGQSIWGSGNIEGSGSGGSSSVVSVVDNGAVGDGITDDTVAIQTALEKARTQGKALFFPNGTYLIKKGLVLTSGMKITGEPNAILRNGTKKAAGDVDFFTTVTASMAAGGTTVTVANASGFEVGQEVVITKASHTSYTETMADITAISGNAITIDTSRFTADGSNGGLLNATGVGGYVLSDFALIKTIITKDAENIVVENITLDAKSDMAEPHIYTSSPISQTRQGGSTQRNFRLYNVTVLASANDGISIQGSGESEVIGCRVYNQKHKGIHWGTNHDMIRIMNNYVYGCGSAQYENPIDYQGSGGMFFCSYCHRTIIIGNHIENCYKGIFGFNYQSNGECDGNTIIANNTFKNCSLYGVILRDGINAVLEANNFLGFGGTSIPIYVDNPNGQHLRNAVIANNTIGEWNVATQIEDAYMPAIKIEGADGIVINGNVISVKKVYSSSPTVDASRCNVVVTSSSNVVITSNITEGNIDTSDSGNTGIVKANNIEST